MDVGVTMSKVKCQVCNKVDIQIKLGMLRRLNLGCKQLYNP